MNLSMIKPGPNAAQSPSEKAVSIPRPEYPSPQWRRDTWLNLNGKWEFQEDPSLSGEEKGYARKNAEFAQTILVPFCPESELSGIGKKDFMPCVWYRRTFQIPEDWRGKQVLLHFGAVDYQATVWVNEKRAGAHRGGYSPFTIDITEYLAPGENIVTLRAEDNVRSERQPAGKQSARLESHGCLYTRSTGIWQTVWIEPVEKQYIRSCKILPDAASGLISCYLDIEGFVEGATVKAELIADGQIAASAEVPAARSIHLALSPNPKRLWSPTNPFLYDLNFTLECKGRTLDRVKSYAALRDVHIRGKKVLLNGQPIFQRLVLDQGYFPTGVYTAPSDEFLKADIERAIAMGFNGARLHQKVFEPGYLYWADRLGFLVWGEYPDWGLDRTKYENMQNVLDEWLSVLSRDFNHPSIIGWCPLNETPWNQSREMTRQVYHATKAADPTRPVIDTSGYIHVETDIYDCHNYEQDPVKFAAAFADFVTTGPAWRNYPDHDAAYQGQPYMVSEYGGMAWNAASANEKAWGYGDKPRTVEEFLARYRKLTETLLNHPNIFGFCYTQLYDVEQEINGLYSYDRKPKFDPAEIRAINAQPAAIERE